VEFVIAARLNYAIIVWKVTNVMPFFEIDFGILFFLILLTMAALKNGN
jgi:hypothetical protein